MSPRPFGYVGMCLTFTGVGISTFPSEVKWCFPVFVCSATMWLLNGILTRNKPQVITQCALIVINTIGIVRWFT